MKIVSKLRAVALARDETSLTRLAQRAQVSLTPVRALWHGYARRVDLHVLARLCAYLRCNISDILVFQDTTDEHDRS